MTKDAVKRLDIGIQEIIFQDIVEGVDLTFACIGMKVPLLRPVIV